MLHQIQILSQTRQQNEQKRSLKFYLNKHLQDKSELKIFNLGSTTRAQNLKSRKKLLSRQAKVTLLFIEDFSFAKLKSRFCLDRKTTIFNEICSWKQELSAHQCSVSLIRNCIQNLGCQKAQHSALVFILEQSLRTSH